MSAPVRTAISAVYEVTFSHYPVPVFKVKIFPFFQIIVKRIASKYVIKITHKQLSAKLGKLDKVFTLAKIKWE